MAKLKPVTTQIFRDPKSYEGADKQVGHNRFIRVRHPVIVCALHRTDILTYDTVAKVVDLYTGGWLTMTTTAAMNDFLALIDHGLRVSRADGELSLHRHGRRIAHDPDGEALAFNLRTNKQVDA